MRKNDPLCHEMQAPVAVKGTLAIDFIIKAIRETPSKKLT